MPLTDGPDFLCVGMHKAGTQWLYDQLQGHSDFWMPPLKELHYLERGERAGQAARKVLDQERSTSRPEATRRTPITDPRDQAFLEEMASHEGKPLDLERYAALFRPKGDLLSGDITPQYGEIDEEIVARVAGRFPQAKILLLLRDPVSRAWSHISQWDRQGRFDTAVMSEPEIFRSFLLKSKKLEKFSCASRVATRWKRHVGEARFHHFFLDDISVRPEEIRRAVLEALGADPQKSSGEIAAGHNRKSEHRKLDLSDENRQVLADYFKDELLACAAMFGSHAANWRVKYGF